jgi:hypothetical protein
MRATPKSGGDALSGHEASAIDSLSGATVVPGAIKTAPGFGNSGVQSGHPFAKAPATKRLTRVAPAFGMSGPGMVAPDDLHELGAAVLAEAAKCARGKK